MSDARKHGHTDPDHEAREQLMREQFERDADAWQKATPIDHVLNRLKSALTRE
jgi:hypothetical protein